MEQLTSWLFKYGLITKTYTKIEDKDLFEAKYFLKKQHPDYLVIAELVDVSPPPLYVLTTNDLDYVVVNSPDLVKTLDGLETDLKRYEYLEKNIRAPYVDNLFFLYNTRLDNNTQEEAPSDSSAAVFLTLLLLVLATNSTNAFFFNKPTNEIEEIIRKMSGNDTFPDSNMEVLRGIFNITGLSDFCAEATNKPKEECATLLAFRSTELWLLRENTKKTMYLCEANRLKPLKQTQKVLGDEITQITDDTEVLYWQTDGCVALDYENLEIIRQFKEYFGNELVDDRTPLGRLEYMPPYKSPMRNVPAGPPASSPSTSVVNRVLQGVGRYTNDQTNEAVALYVAFFFEDLEYLNNSVYNWDYTKMVEASIRICLKYPVGPVVAGIKSGFTTFGVAGAAGLQAAQIAYNAANYATTTRNTITTNRNEAINADGHTINTQNKNQSITTNEGNYIADVFAGSVGLFIGGGIHVVGSMVKYTLVAVGFEGIVATGVLLGAGLALDKLWYLGNDDLVWATRRLNFLENSKYWTRVLDETAASKQYQKYILDLDQRKKHEEETKMLNDKYKPMVDEIYPGVTPSTPATLSTLPTLPPSAVGRSDIVLTPAVANFVGKRTNTPSGSRNNPIISGRLELLEFDERRARQNQTSMPVWKKEWTRKNKQEQNQQTKKQTTIDKYNEYVDVMLQKVDAYNISNVVPKPLYEIALLVMNESRFYELVMDIITQLNTRNVSFTDTRVFDYTRQRLSKYITSHFNMTEQEFINRHWWLELYVTAQNQIYQWSYSGNETLKNISLKDNYVEWINYHERTQTYFGVGVGVGVAGFTLYKYLSKDNSTKWNYAKHYRNPKTYKHLLEPYVYNLVKYQSDYTEEDKATLQLFDTMKHSKNWFKPTGYTVDQLLHLIPEYKLGDFYVDNKWDYDGVIEYYKAMCEACGFDWQVSFYFRKFLETKKGDTVYFTENDKKTLTSIYARIR